MKHNKFFSFLTTVMVGASAAAAPVSITAGAASNYGTFNGLDYTYDTETNEAKITDYRGSDSTVEIPSVINGYTVTEIGTFAFYNQNVVEVVIPDTVRTIDYGAFQKSTVESVTIPASVTTIDQRAFLNCTSLKSLTVLGATELNCHSFENCTALEEVQLSDDSQTYRYFGHEAFYNCPSLYKVNGVQALQYETDSNGIEYPVINPAIEQSIRNHFSRSINVGFVDDYCTELCDYIVETETDDWMCDALKARQLHDWIVRHCDYEDRLNGEKTSDNENHVASSVFLSYAINVRGEGNGETVCDGFAKAYTMLLSAAGIESYHIGHTMHAWNLVKIDGKFYHVDVTNDNSYAGSNLSPYGTNYTYFLKKSLHGGNIVQNHPSDHPLLMVYNNNVNNEIKNCPQDYPDKNRDGIMDDDFNLNGTGVSYGDFNGDLNAWHHWEFMFGGSMDTLNDKLPEIFDYLRRNHESYDTYLANSSPKNVSAAVNTTATFKVTLFGDNLTYQWQYYNTNTGKWENVNSTTAKTPTLKITVKSGMNNRQFGCIVTNKNGNCIYSDIAKLTVS
ncbi:leucine-rich repeat domain-containing protein [Ruminococcus flavefaciens]|uniref:Leucine rich repeat-containing protein n=1 Tax=Ruminococcus flavefaciens TaxID=1265 RepID=A0A1M7IE42_RUMFL|nr:leucine-rich repeat domain-containing protein [Ruminococcus flavefaciens]SHM38949.1 Leucine rich repeat-containing protein [Ruminococcus flavefaciens]